MTPRRRRLRAILRLASIAAGLASVAARAQMVSVSPPLGLEEAVAQALAKNFAISLQRLPVEQARDSVVIQQSNFYPTFGLTSERTVLNEASEVGTFNGTLFTEAGTFSDTTATTATVADSLLTGATVNASYSLEKLGSNSPFQFPNPLYLGDVSLTVAQPLLQGAGLDYGRASIERAKIGVRIAQLNLKSAVLTVIYNTETAYFDLIYSREQYDVGRASLQLAQNLLDDNTQKRRSGVLADLDVLQAQVGVAAARSQLISFRQAVQNSEDALLEDLGDREFRAPVGAVDFPPLGGTDVSFDLSYKLARDNGPSLAVVGAMIEQFKLDALKAKRDELPVLSVNGGVGYNSAQYDYSQAASRLWNGSGYNWQAGFSLSFPWGMAQNRALYRQAMANVRSEELTREQTDQQLVVQVRSAVRAVQTDVESLRAAAEQTSLSEKQYELQKAKFDAGLATSYDVLQAQNQLEASQLSELQAKVSLRLALADLHFLEGSSLDVYRVNVK